METLESLILLSGSCYAVPVEVIVDCEPVCPTGAETSITTVGNDASSTDPLVFEGDVCPDPFVPPVVTLDDCPEPPTDDDFDSILKWNDVMLEANANDYLLDKADQQGPILTARAFAIVSAAMYDAYNSIEKIGEQYLITAEFTNGANADAAVSQAAFETLVELFPSQEGFFESKLHESLSRIEDGASKDLGRTIGAHVAESILEARSNDLYTQFLTGQYLPSGLPGFHDVDPLNPNQGFYAPGTMYVMPFAVESLDQFQDVPFDDRTPDGRLEFLGTEKYTEAYNEVKRLGGDGTTTPTERTVEQTNIGMFWAYDGRPGLGTPPRLYNQVVREVAEQQGNTEAENARLFALVNLAMADAGFTSWNTKYDDALWRPVLGIREGDIDGNSETVGDIDWRPLGAPASNPRPGEINFTPPFPAYTSGHATFGAAMFQTLTRFYGTDDISFSFVSDELNGITIDADGSIRERVERSFDSFTQAKIENAWSRIYLGIHWNFDASDGITMGDSVANYVFDNFLRA